MLESVTDDELIELWEERAAIIEFDAKVSRKEAERRAYVQLKRLYRPNDKMPEQTARWR